MKSQELKSVGAEGTLIGTALGTAFSLWGLGTAACYLVITPGAAASRVARTSQPY